MNALDFHQPLPRVRTLDEAQALIERLRGLSRVVQEQQTCIERLEERLRLNSGNSPAPIRFNHYRRYRTLRSNHG